MYSPNTIVYLLNTPLVMGDNHQLKFNSKADQTSYFSSKVVFSFTDNNAFTFQRKDSYIRIPKNIESLYTCNYVMYKNSQFSNKYFYAFITNMEYVNENVTNLYIQTDVYQTWQFDITFNKSFIERQHPVTDNYNTLADSPAHGQLIQRVSQDFNFTGGYLLFCNTDITQDVPSGSNVFNFVIEDYTIPTWVIYFSENEANKLTEVIQYVSAKGYGDRLQACVYVPYLGNISQSDYSDIPLVTGNPTGLRIKLLTGLSNYNTNLIQTFLFNWGLVFNTLEIKCKKALTMPYSVIRVTDATGLQAEYSLEKFAELNSNYCQFVLNGTISEMPTYKIFPKNYCGEDVSRQNGLVVKCNTTLPLLNNQYAKYLLNNNEINSLNREKSNEMTNLSNIQSNLNIANTVGQGVIGGALTYGKQGGITGGLIGGATGAGVGITNSLIQQHINNRQNFYTQSMITAQENVASRLPNQITAITDDAMERLLFSNKIRISLYTMDDIHFQKAIKYWKTFGYPVNTLDIPNLTQNGFGDDYNFIKMISPNIEGGNVPNNDIREIETMFSSGITLWHNPETFKKY